MTEENNFVAWAREEIQRAGLFDEDSDYEGMLGRELMKMVETFSAARHSGFSASLTVHLFSLIAAHKPLTPITNAEDEWMHIDKSMVGESNLWQSRRQPSLFSYDGGKTYYDLDEKPSRWNRLIARLLRKRARVFHEAVPA